jgi:hypothetical protein
MQQRTKDAMIDRMTPSKIYFDGGCKPNPGEREVTAPTTKRKGSPRCGRSI